jgi:solute:Na+ symporter, SSS family
MTTLDILIVVGYFVMTIAAGVYCHRQASKSVRSYFLGDNKQPWWMLAVSGAATHYSLEGTIWNAAMLIVLGMKSWWIVLIWWMPNSVFLMAYSAIWIRRTGVVTSAELNKVRFGIDAGAKAARIGFAVMIVLFSLASLSLSYIVIHKFAAVFGLPAHLSALLVIGITGVYVLAGGFSGVVITDFLQALLKTGMSLIVGAMVFMHYAPSELQTAVAHDTVTTEYWKSFVYDPHPDLGVFKNNKSYAGWNDLVGTALAFSLVGFIGCLGGAGGRYGEQRFLATKNSRHAAWQAAFWQFLALPRWIFTAALVFLAFTSFRGVTIGQADPEAVLPAWLQSGMLAPGMMGFMVAALVAVYMSTFSGEVNAGASILVRDIYEPLFKHEKDVEEGGHIWPSYIATAGMVVAAMVLGYNFTENSTLNRVWTWMLGGLLTCIVVPLALRWYWGRMNGWGYSVGTVVGLVPALMMLSKQFVGPEAWVQGIPDAWFTYSILALSLTTCVVVSVLTPPVEAEQIDDFYRKVRPFGLWGSVARRALASGKPANTPINPGLALVNIVLGILATYSLYMSPVYFMGKWYHETGVCLGIFAACSVALYFTWYKNLPEN